MASQLQVIDAKTAALIAEFSTNQKLPAIAAARTEYGKAPREIRLLDQTGALVWFIKPEKP